MRGRGKRDRLDRRLEDERPQARDEFVSTVADRLTSEPVRHGAIWRTAFAVGFTMLLVLAFALTGGIGYAASAVQGGTTAVTSLVTGPSTTAKAAKKANRQERANNLSSSTALTSSSESTITSSSESTESSSEDDEEESEGEGDDDDDSPSDDQYEDDVLICHHPLSDPEDVRTIQVDADEVERHLAHGDTLGPCPDEEDDEEDDD